MGKCNLPSQRQSVSDFSSIRVLPRCIWLATAAYGVLHRKIVDEQHKALLILTPCQTRWLRPCCRKLTLNTTFLYDECFNKHIPGTRTSHASCTRSSSKLRSLADNESWATPGIFLLSNHQVRWTSYGKPTPAAHATGVSLPFPSHKPIFVYVVCCSTIKSQFSHEAQMPFSPATEIKWWLPWTRASPLQMLESWH